MKRRTSLEVLALSALLPGMAARAQPAAYPSRPIKVLVGFPAGTIIDVVARLVVDEMNRRMGQPVLVENRAGANGTIAAKAVVNAEPDGYTLYFGTTSTIHPLLNRTNGVDAARELTPISESASPPFYLLARSSLGVNSLVQLTEWVKTNPDKLTYGAPSATADMLMALVKARTGVAARGIPYKGSTQVAVALMADEVDLTAATAQSFLPQIRSGKLKPLFVMAPRRLALLPDVPTAAELGVRDLELSTNLGLWAPPKTPAAIIQTLTTHARAAVATPSVAEAIRNIAAEPVGSAPEALLKVVEAENRAWAEAAKLANYQPQ